jgi:hypothetical protein
MWNCRKGVNKVCIYISKMLQNVSTMKYQDLEFTNNLLWRLLYPVDLVVCNMLIYLCSFIS